MKEKITLSLDQHENARHGEEIFPLQKYVTPLWKEYPYVTAHWHEEAEFTRIGKGSCTYQIHLETYDVEEGDLIFIPPAVLHAISNEKEERMQSETYVFHMDFLGAKAADICAIRYLNPLMNQKLIPPFVIKKGHPLYEKAADLFEDINTEYDKKTPGYEIAIKSYLLQLVAALIVRARPCFQDGVFRVPKNGMLETNKPLAMRVVGNALAYRKNLQCYNNAGSPTALQAEEVSIWI